MRIVTNPKARLLVAAIPKFRESLLGNAIIATSDLEERLASTFIEVFDTDAIEYMNGREEITREIIGCSEKKLEKLDDKGVVRFGSHVEHGDILIGKIFPKRFSEISREERILYSLFGIHGEDVSDISVRYPFLEPGLVIGTHYTPHISHKERISCAKVYVSIMKRLEVGDILQDKKENRGVVASIEDISITFSRDQRTIDAFTSLESGLFETAENIEEKYMWRLEFRNMAEIRLYNSDVKNPRQPGCLKKEYLGKGRIGYIEIERPLLLCKEKMSSRSTGPYSIISQQPIIIEGGAELTSEQISSLQSHSEIVRDAMLARCDSMEERALAYGRIIKNVTI